jgi:carbon starvation protein
VLGVMMGVALRYLKMPLWLATVIFVPRSVVAIWLGQHYPIELPTLRRPAGPVLAWDYLILVYCAVASVMPVWAAAAAARLPRRLFPLRDDLRVLHRHPVRRHGDPVRPRSRLRDAKRSARCSRSCSSPSPAAPAAASTASSARAPPASRSTNETDAHVVGYGGMLLEGVVAVIALITA